MFGSKLNAEGMGALGTNQSTGFNDTNSPTTNKVITAKVNAVRYNYNGTEYQTHAQRAHNRPEVLFSRIRAVESRHIPQNVLMGLGQLNHLLYVQSGILKEAFDKAVQALSQNDPSLRKTISYDQLLRMPDPTQPTTLKTKHFTRDLASNKPQPSYLSQFVSQKLKDETCFSPADCTMKWLIAAINQSTALANDPESEGTVHLDGITDVFNYVGDGIASSKNSRYGVIIRFTAEEEIGDMIHTRMRLFPWSGKGSKAFPTNVEMSGVDFSGNPSRGVFHEIGTIHSKPDDFEINNSAEMLYHEIDRSSRAVQNARATMKVVLNTKVVVS